MENDIKPNIVKSPFPNGVMQKSWTDRTTVNITLSNGIIITDLQQFEEVGDD